MTAAVIEQVCAVTMRWPFRLWGFGEAIALRGLLAAAGATGDREPLGFVSALLRQYVARGVGKSPEEHVAPARELLLLYEGTKEQDLLLAARQLADLYVSFPKNSRSARMHRPDLPGWSRQIWVDCMDSEPPFLVQLGELTGDEAYVDQGAEELAAYARLLQDARSGLFYHGFEELCGRNGQTWARGNGWALMGLVDTLLNLPHEHVLYGELTERLDKLCAGLCRYQADDGFWNTIVPDARTYKEATLPAMVASVLPLAFGAGLLDRGKYREMERRAREAVLRVVGEDGTLQFVSEATPIGEWGLYASRKFGCFPWGQGALLLMLAQT